MTTSDPTSAPDSGRETLPAKMSANPLETLRDWFEEAQGLGLREPSAMTLATATRAGAPSVRVVLLKEIRAAGLVFFTNYLSRKGQELAENPQAAVNFYWDGLQRQVEVRGRVEKVAQEESEAYWRSRERARQISQWVSAQSQPVTSRRRLDELYEKAESQWAGQDVPCPEHWGGYFLLAEEVELWIGRPDRFHDRFRFARAGLDQAWTWGRLYP